MSFHQIHSWTLSGLIRAFLDLAVVYFLLCVSATVFIPSQILKVVGFCLPCSCTGFYGIQNPDFCLLGLLVDWPKRKIYLVLQLLMGRFPFDLILIDGEMGNSNRSLSRRENHHVGEILPQLQSEACYSECDGNKGSKRVVYQRPRPRPKIRRRRKTAAVENGKLFLKAICEGNETRKERELVALVERQDFIPDDVNESNHLHLGEKTWEGFESSGSVGENSYTNQGSSTIGQGSSNAQERGIIRNEVSSIRLLERALEEERAARASLFQELEEERAAAATAADEAIAMITRLQNKKASVEMEARQYQREIEEKFAYDKEEMNILQEILVKKEIDYHVLEKEIEVYRQMDFSENEQLKRNWDFILDERSKGQSATTHYSNGDPPIVHQFENAISLSRKAKLSETIRTDKDDELRDCGFEKSLLSRGELQESLEHIDRIDRAVNDLGSSILDMEIDIQDIHVIDEKLHMENTKEEKKS